MPPESVVAGALAAPPAPAAGDPVALVGLVVVLGLAVGGRVGACVGLGLLAVLGGALAAATATTAPAPAAAAARGVVVVQVLVGAVLDVVGGLVRLLEHGLLDGLGGLRGLVGGTPATAAAGLARRLGRLLGRAYRWPARRRPAPRPRVRWRRDGSRRAAGAGSASGSGGMNSTAGGRAAAFRPRVRGAGVSSTSSSSSGSTPMTGVVVCAATGSTGGSSATTGSSGSAGASATAGAAAFLRRLRVAFTGGDAASSGSVSSAGGDSRRGSRDRLAAAAGRGGRCLLARRLASMAAPGSAPGVSAAARRLASRGPRTAHGCGAFGGIAGRSVHSVPFTALLWLVIEHGALSSSGDPGRG